MKNHACVLLIMSGLLGVVASYSGAAADAAGDQATQVAAQSSSDSSDTQGLAQIVVTAQRRSQSEVNVPMSLSVESGATLQATGIADLSDLQYSTPGFSTVESNGYTQIYIRGIGNRVLVGADPAVATFIDDVPRPYGALVNDLVNVDRVEVLKGAQGGLYGGNATGGVVNIVTRQPTDTFTANVQLSGGNYSLFEGSAFVSGPIIDDRVDASLAVTRKVHDPFQNNLVQLNPYPTDATITDPANGLRVSPNLPIERADVNNEDFYTVAAKVKIRATDDIKVTLGADYNDKNDASAVGFYNNQPGVTYASYLGLGTALGLTYFVPPWGVPPHGSTWAPVTTFARDEDYGVDLRVDWNLPGVDLTSISAQRYNKATYESDIAAAPVPVFGSGTDFARHFFYQELRAVSNLSGPIHFLAGGSFFGDHADNLLQIFYLGFLAGDINSVATRDNFAGYGQVDYDLTSRLNFMASLRYVNDWERGTYPATVSSTEAGGVDRETKVIPSATLSYHLNEGTAYVRYANGFKQGGLNPIVSPVYTGGVPNAFRPETVNTYEVGYRTRIFDDRIELTSAIFYNDYKNLQTTKAGNTNIPFFVLTGGNARSFGAEAGVNWRIANPLTLSANIGFVDAKYLDYSYAGSETLGIPAFNGSGNPMALAPRWQGGASAHFNQPINDRFTFDGSLLYSFTGAQNFEDLNNPAETQHSYSIVNMRVGVLTLGGHLGLYAFCNNVLDKFYLTNGNLQGPGGTILTPGNPRVGGLTLQYNYQ